jgi:hypothetical protein
VAVDDAFMTQQPATVHALSAAGIVILRAGDDSPHRTGWFHSDSGIDRSAKRSTELAGARPRFYLRTGSLDALDVFRVRRSGAEFVSPNLLVKSGDQTPPRLRVGQIVLLECAGHTDCHLDSVLSRLRDQPVTFGSLTELGR